MFSLFYYSLTLHWDIRIKEQKESNVPIKWSELWLWTACRDLSRPHEKKYNDPKMHARCLTKGHSKACVQWIYIFLKLFDQNGVILVQAVSIFFNNLASKRSSASLENEDVVDAG